jgi:hypothetical protein
MLSERRRREAQRNAIAVLLAAGALALGACGGDDGGGDTVGATQPTATTETTATTNTNRTGTTRERTGTNEDRTSTRERGDDGGGRNSGRGSDDSGSGSRGGDDSGSTQPAAQPGNVRKVAQTVCNSFLPKAVERDLEQDDRKPEDVARDYSRGFPENQQKAAYEGCLAGLEKRR